MVNDEVAVFSGSIFGVWLQGLMGLNPRRSVPLQFCEDGSVSDEKLWWIDEIDQRENSQGAPGSD